MTEPGSQTAGYVVGVVLAVPLVLLGLFVAGLLGPLWVAVGVLVTGLCTLGVSRARSRDAARTSST